MSTGYVVFNEIIEIQIRDIFPDSNTYVGKSKMVMGVWPEIRHGDQVKDPHDVGIKNLVLKFNSTGLFLKESFIPF